MPSDFKFAKTRFPFGLTTLTTEKTIPGTLAVHEFNLHLTRNASGYIVEIESVAAHALDALSKHLNFTYSILQKCDLIIGLVVMTPRRLAVMDFAEGFAYTPVVLLIPMPESPNQISQILLNQGSPSSSSNVVIPQAELLYY
ncbi:hypothetical protein DAPPUDRAFT_237396 [Daphnia pulex]|uniref:Uncharacterized protein n=1 Tax=Daphnia pulex TaxID=6669 RepID=E9G3T8_DAPPU|nr:hypothetical protein DAPPUDRAFT_237396 [Daphnia pulex]|eukprot:EFX85930.1 hypothetical protein DAPPUDRAFT_237396 [Daphnia pulex]